ncbi:DUF4433 domain-containing protein [Gloeocapsa sp. PCC 73106]|uniref:DUF4433 domain-containing protein n=1 Tax=Gloeocapsa sp. PCC 73106 TaxID=102232 RepID=UPI0002ABAF9F|nr:DUF4433 domain-containing protein [Gloeocapsa sp. PCC 73106]ELR97588.1 hypothetical protein GLO73106DRAFT_00013980 [Gloeocapsa sp. PCC 73106]
MKQIEELLAEYEIDYLYHMTYVDNLGSILLRGLLSRQQTCSQNLTYTDISDQEVQKRRSCKIVRGIPLHGYVPLYFNPRNPMLFVRKNLQSQIAILGIDPLVLLQPHSVFSDGNAACSNTVFYKDLSSLSRLNWKIIRQSIWYDQPDGKRIKCAEVLVYPQIAVRNILSVFCYSDEMVADIKKLRQDHLRIEVNRNLYF